MLTTSRREFLKAGSASVLSAATVLNSSGLTARSLDLPLGIELYSVRTLLPTDYGGTLKQIAALGYREVESVGWANFYNHTPTQAKHTLQQAGLNCVSVFYTYEILHRRFDQVLAANKELGADYIVIAFPGLRNPSSKNSHRSGNGGFTVEDWRWNAEQLNVLGEKINAAGMKFAYHNHTMEFQKQDGIVPYDDILRLTDPSKVTMEMDIGWVIVGGGNPVEYFHRYPMRFSMLHVKDFKMLRTPPSEEHQQYTADHPPPTAELGRGSIDYRPILREAAKTQHIRHCFVEQENYDMPIISSLKIDAEYMRMLNA